MNYRIFGRMETALIFPYTKKEINETVITTRE